MRGRRIRRRARRLRRHHTRGRQRLPIRQRHARRDRRHRIAIVHRVTRRRDRHRLLVDRDRAAGVGKGVVGGRAARARGRRRHPYARRDGVRRRARLPGDHAGRGAVDEADVVGQHRRHGVGGVDGVASRRYVDILLTDRHGAGRVREGVVRGDGTRARGRAVGERGCNRGGRRVIRRAVRHRGEHRLVLAVDPAGVNRRDRRHGVVVGDARA